MTAPNSTGDIYFPGAFNPVFKNCIFGAQGVDSESVVAQEIVKSRQLSLLSSIPRAPFAAYDALRIDRAKSCLRGTRKTVLEAIDAWAQHPDPHHPPIFWLNGLAGIGKTTIAYTVASFLNERNQLGGSFFFQRLDDQLKDARLVLPTLAWQLSQVDQHVQARLVEVLGSNAGCVNQDIATQFEHLIFTPLSSTSRKCPLVLVLDALDECQPNDFTADILRVLIDNITRIPFLRVLITSRPEAHIREALGIVKDGRLVPQKLVLHENAEVQAEVETDIRHYLRTSLQDIWSEEQSRLGEWPSPGDLEILVQQSGKFFIYAATLVRKIGRSKSSTILNRRLDSLLKLRTHSPIGPAVRSDKHLDALYLHIFETALVGMDMADPYVCNRYRRIVGSVMLMEKPIPMESLANFLGDYKVEDLKDTLHDLHSVLIVPDDASLAVYAYHLSLANFITDATRCTAQNAYINPSQQHFYLFLRCINTFERLFGSNIPQNTTGPSKTRNLLRRWIAAFQRPFGRWTQPTAIESDQVKYAEEDARHRLGKKDSAQGNNNNEDFYEGNKVMTPDVRYASNHWCSHLTAIRIQSSTGQNVEDDVLQPEEAKELRRILPQFIRDYLSLWLDERIKHISPMKGALADRRVRDTFDIMQNADRWISYHTIDLRQSQIMRQVIDKSSKRLTDLFPSNNGVDGGIHLFSSASNVIFRNSNFQINTVNL